MQVRNYRELRVWAKAHELTLALYAATRNMPRDELYGLTSQLRRAVVSIEANLAEGCGRRGDGDMVRFVQIATGSASELDCHLLIARDLKFLSDEDHARLAGLLQEVRRMLTSFANTIETSKAQVKAARAAKS